MIDVDKQSKDLGAYQDHGERKIRDIRQESLERTDQDLQKGGSVSVSNVYNISIVIGKSNIDEKTVLKNLAKGMDKGIPNSLLKKLFSMGE